MTKDRNSPKQRMIDMKRNPPKCFYENILKIPKTESKSNVAPLKKYADKDILKQIIRFTKIIER